MLKHFYWTRIDKELCTTGNADQPLRRSKDGEEMQLFFGLQRNATERCVKTQTMAA